MGSNRKDPPEARTALLQAAQRRRARIAAADQDHFDRTRHSFVYGGMELGYVKPTAETAARLRPDPIVRLVANETLTREQGKAAVEIRQVFERIAAGLLSRSHDPAGASGGAHRTEVSDRIATLHATRYLPWARYLGGDQENGEDALNKARERLSEARRLRLHDRIASAEAELVLGQMMIAGRCRPALEVAIEVLIDGCSLAECDAARRWRRGTATTVLTYALAVYADRAGWENSRKAIAAFEALWARRRGT